jgi:predicted small metal-binding protein
MKALHCQDLGLACDYVARGKDEQEVMSKAAEYAKKDHGMEQIPDEVVAKARSVIRDE